MGSNHKSQDTSSAWANYVKNMSKRDDRPNILLLMTDQQRFDTIAAAGYAYMNTPNLDRLVRDGCLYVNAYSPNPICIPARHNIITGLSAKYHGFADNDFDNNFPYSIPTLPRILSDNGYETRAIGKMHFRPVRRHHGFDKMELMEEVPEYREQDEYAMYLKEVGLGNIQNLHGVRNLLYMVPQRSLVPEAHHGTAWVADRTIEFIQKNKGRHPFFLWTSWIAPHPPFNVVDEYAQLYKRVDFPDPYISQTPTSLLAKESCHLGDLPNEKYVRRMRELYYGAISHVDYHIGRILDALEQEQLLDNTVILFTSDHGEMLGDHGTYQKWLPYDSSARIPFIIRYPKQFGKGKIIEKFVDLNDILPTILDCANIDYPGQIDLPGESLLSTQGRKNRNYQFLEHGRGSKRWISIRDCKYKYNYYYGGGYEELFNMIEDPHETLNLLFDNEDDSHTIIKKDLKSKLLEYELRIGLEGVTVHRKLHKRLNLLK